MKGMKAWPVYEPRTIEPRWQSQWEQEGLHLAGETSTKPKYYCLDFFPYPSGDGLHVGHCRNYIPTDVISRYKRMKGFNVLHPMGWDAFGEPAEQYAAQHGVHPRLTTDRNTANFRRQLTLIGAGYDWDREIDSSDPDFYRWTQFFFLKLYQCGLVYRDSNWQWWCDGCQTTLSSHEVAGGVCWRGHTSIYKREIPAWYFRISAYAEELLNDLDQIDWPDPIKTMQRNWIGRSEGCEIIFQTEAGQPLSVFSTRPETVYGVTFFVLAPEHPLVSALTITERRLAVEAYIAQTVRQSEIDRQKEARDKTGLFTGGYVINPVNGERIPVWISDYVLPSYGFGALMGVPAHDQHDFDFARHFHLPIRVVVSPEKETLPDGESLTAAYIGDGYLVNSGPYNGMPVRTAAQRICADLTQSGKGVPRLNYRMHDWLISRQRYWGAPIPIVYCSRCGIQPVPEEDLPVLLPPMMNFAPDGSGRSPLQRLPGFVHTVCPGCKGPAERETDTMGGFACSSWYFLRFTSPHYGQGPFDPQAMRYWMPVDLYVGGAEHAVLHLLYARFWIKALAKAGFVPFREPFSKLINQGQLLGADGARMSKSRGNVITPDSIVELHGADALRIYEMFMAPFEQDVAWSMDGISGAARFLSRVWTLIGECYFQSAGCANHDPELTRVLHKTIRRIEERIESFRFNTMISTLMEFVNRLSELQRSDQWQTVTFHRALETLILLLAPSAPHIASELWELTGHDESVHRQDWPTWDADLARDEVVQIPIQVDGRRRDVLEVSPDAAMEDVRAAALGMERVRQQLDGRTVDHVVYVPGKIINIVTRINDSMEPILG